MTVGGRGCDNLWVTLTVADARLRALHDSGRTGVLLVTADAVTRGTRLNQDARTVMSDGAGSCLISLKPSGASLRVLATAAAPVSPPQDATPMVRARHSVHALRALSDQVFDMAQLPRSGCTLVVTSNVGLNIAHMFRSAVGCGSAPLYRPVAGDVGHCFAADGIHTLGLLLKDPESKVGDIVLTIATSPDSCSLMLLEVAGKGLAEESADG
jgi:3-oxoacyl-[acyl-carrier-protein] synthase-3